jgi:hypothetical protein
MASFSFQLHSTPDHAQLEFVAQDLNEHIKNSIAGCDLKIVFYRRGDRNDQNARFVSALNDHPCQSSLQELCAAIQRSNEHSRFSGVAFSQSQTGFLGLKKQLRLCALIHINLDQYQNNRQALYDLFYMTAQAVDCLSLVLSEKISLQNRLFVLPPKRDNESLARTNLKADAFSALMMAHYGDKDAIDQLSTYRGRAALMPIPNRHPEFFPFPISKEVTEYALNAASSLPENDFLTLYKLAQRVAKSFDHHNLIAWENFTKIAQTMAWRSYRADQILGAAIHTSPDPFIKSTGHLLSTITGISPLPEDELRIGFNPFVSLEINDIQHRQMMEDHFDMAIIHAEEAESAAPLMRLANGQNLGLLNGQFSGWCAGALHAAAKAYQGAKEKGHTSPYQASRLEFESQKSLINLSQISKICDDITEKARQGYAMTLQDLMKWCANNVEFTPLVQSLHITIQDPDYQQKYVLNNELPQPKPMPSYSPHTPHAKPSAPHYAPQAHVAPAGFAGGLMGGGVMGGGGLMGNSVVTKASPQKASSTTQTDST